MQSKQSSWGTAEVVVVLNEATTRGCQKQCHDLFDIEDLDSRVRKPSSKLMATIKETHYSRLDLAG